MKMKKLTKLAAVLMSSVLLLTKYRSRRRKLWNMRSFPTIRQSP